MILRRAMRQELDLALDWAAREGWNPGLNDAAAFWAADPDGFFVAEMSGHPAAFVSVVNHSADHAFLGLYLCGPDWRGRGIGMALWTHALPHAGTRSITLDGVAAQQANYARSGFVRIGATQRWQGHMAAVRHPGVRPATPDDLPLLAALDAAANGYRRDGFLSLWTSATPTRHTVVLRDGTGFATARRCRAGIKVGPVVAPDAASALHLIQSLPHGTAATDLITLDLPDTNSPLAALVAKAGFAVGFTTARMVKGDPPQASPLLQAIATMELG